MNNTIVLAVLFALCGGAQRLHAQEATPDEADTTYFLSPVIVNPQEAKERETPATFSNLSRDEVAKRYSVQDIPVLLSDLPSTTFYSENGNGIGYNYINIRGFDQRRLSIMINGVPQNDPEDHNVYWIDFPDLLASAGAIQVQRGAGSSFYGPPAIGGSINITTNPFTRQPGITLESDFGFQEFSDSARSLPLNTRRVSAALQSGLIDNTYMIYGRVGTIRSDGYRTNAWVQLNSYFLGAVRFDSTMTTRIHIFGGPLTDGLAYGGLPKFVNSNPVLRRQNLNTWDVDSTGAGYQDFTYRRPQETENFFQPHAELLHEWRISSQVTLSNVIFYYTGDGWFDYDASWADTSMLRIGSQYGFPTTANPSNTLVRAFVGNKQWGWLPRVEIDHGSGALSIGAEIRIHRSTHWGKIQYAENLPPGFDPDYHFYEYNGEKDILSSFVQERYRPSATVTVQADVQFVHNRYGIANEKFLGYNFSLPYFFVNPRLGLNYNITDLWNGYISIGYTSREPRLRNLYAAEDSYFGATPQFADTSNGLRHYDFSKPIAGAEHLIDVELGAGYHSADAHLSANLYWMEFTGELVENGQLDIFGQPVTSNADRTRHIGLETEGSWRFLPSLTFSGNFCVSSNKLIHYRITDTSGTTTLDGNPIAGFPDVLANLRLSHTAGDLSSTLSVKYVGSFHTDNFNDPHNLNDAYAVADCMVLYRGMRAGGVEWTLRAEAHNIFNRLYLLSGDGNAFFPAAERNYLLGISVHI